MHSNKVQWRLQQWPDHAAVRRDSDEACQIGMCVHSSKLHMYAAEPDSSVSCWPSGAQHVCTWTIAKQSEERVRACLHCTPPSSITLNRKVIDYETRAGQGEAESADSCPRADNTWHANTGDVQQHSASRIQLDRVPHRTKALLPPPRRLCFHPCLSVCLFVCFVCLFVSRIMQKLVNEFPWNMLEGWDMGQERTHSVLVQIQTREQV